MGGEGEGDLSIPYPINFGQNIPCPVNSCGLYPYNASYHDDVIQRDMLRYLITKNIYFPGAFRISNRNYVQIRNHVYRWYALMQHSVKNC